jgi:hypothetical protein
MLVLALMVLIDLGVMIILLMEIPDVQSISSRNESLDRPSREDVQFQAQSTHQMMKITKYREIISKGE